MGVKTDTPKSHIQKVRISENTRDRCLTAKASGAHAEDSESDFYGYLIQLGIQKYEKVILPAELDEDQQTEAGRRAINE